MNASNDTVVTVMEIVEDAGIGPLSLTQVRDLADAIVTTWPVIEVVEEPPTPKPRSHWKRWDAEEEDMLRVMFEGGLPTGEIAEKLNRSKGAILGAVSRLKLKRNP